MPRRGSDTSSVRSGRSGRTSRSHRSLKSSRSAASTANSTTALQKGGPEKVERRSEAERAMVFQTADDDGVVDLQREKANADPRKWVNTLMGCCHFMDTCAYGCFCIPCATATAVNRFDSSSWALNCLCMSPCVARNYIRKGYNIRGHCGSDLCAGLLCTPCVSVQLLNETEERGSILNEWGRHPHRTTFLQPWKFGLCSCCEDPGNCFYAGICWPCAVGSIRNSLDGTDWIFNCLLLTPCIARSMVRSAYNIEGSCANDCMLNTCCLPCSLCQMLNEVQQRGRIDMTSRGLVVGNLEMANYMKR